MSLCPYSARSPHSPEPCILTDQNFPKNVLKGSPKEHSCEVISESDQGFQRRFFKNFFMSVYCKHTPNMAIMFFHGSEFRKQILKNTEKKTLPPLTPRRPCFSTDQNFANNFKKRVTQGTIL